MKDDYLWDKSGEPDPEVQQLEQILGTLRYQPRPLEIPDDLVVHRRRNYFPLLAIAATFIIALLAAGLWWRATSQKAPIPVEVRVQQPAPTLTINQELKDKTVATDNNHGPSPVPGVHRHRQQPANLVAINRKRRDRSSTPALTAAQEKEAEEAKAQLLMALRVASEKLNLVQRKAQGGTVPNQIRNQHKIG
jgi:hypothetical protein